MGLFYKRIPLELELLRLCARTHGYSQEKISALLKKKINWQVFLDIAYQNRLACFLYFSAKKLKSLEDAMPESTQVRFKEIYIQTTCRNNLLLQQFLGLSQFFQSNQLDFALFKGMDLAIRIYKDIGLRDFSDFDILVKKEDLVLIDSLLRKQGYRPYSNIDPSELGVYSSYRNSLMYHYRDASKIPLHIHWHIQNLFSKRKAEFLQKDIQRIWNSLQKVAWEKVDYLTLKDEHLLSYLCLHSFAHGFKELLHLCDINQFIIEKKYNFPWSKFIFEGIELGLSLPIYYALFFAKKILKSDIPDWVLEKMNPGRSGFLTKKIYCRVQEARPLIIDSFLLLWEKENNFLSKLRLLKKALLPPHRVMGIIRQKKENKISILDYIKRGFAYLYPALKALF